MSAPIEDGARVRLCRELTDEERRWNPFPRYGGKEFTVDEVWQPRPAEERESDEIDVPIVYGSDDHGSSVGPVPLDAVEVIKTAADMRARTIPTVAELRREISSELCGLMGDAFDTDESIHFGETGIEVYGKTHDGLGFGFQVHITRLWETDL